MARRPGPMDRTTCPLCRRPEVPLGETGRICSHRAQEDDHFECRASGYRLDDVRLAELVAREQERRAVYDAWAELERHGIERADGLALADAIGKLKGKFDQDERLFDATREHLSPSLLELN